MQRYRKYAGMIAWLCTLLAAVDVASAQDRTPPQIQAGQVIASLSTTVEPAQSITSNPWVLEWIAKVKELPPIEPRKIQGKTREFTVDEAMFYSRYSSPLAYLRALDLACNAGFEPNPGAKVFDFGYGNIAHLRMLALSGLHAVGVEVDPLLKLIYEKENGPLGTGSVHVYTGHFPGDKELVEQIGGDFDLILSKNVLKNGYINPAREVNPQMLIDLGVDDKTFLQSIAKMLKPNGLFVIYNFCPAKAPDDQPYLPHSDGESPFTKGQFAVAGFEVLHFNVVDDSEARRVAHALGWDAGGMKLDKDLFAWYTIVRKKPPQAETKP